MNIRSSAKKVLKNNRFIRLTVSRFLWTFFNKRPTRNQCSVFCPEAFLLGNKFTIKKREYKNKITAGDGAILRNCSVSISGSNNKIIVGRDARLYGVALVIEDDNCEIQIGDRTVIYQNTELAAMEGTKIVIGEDCLFSSFVHVRTGDSHSVINLKGERINRSKDVIIGRHNWFGRYATILKGTSIIDNNIIGTFALINKRLDVSNCVIAGCPANVVKENVNWETARI